MTIRWFCPTRLQKSKCNNNCIECCVTQSNNKIAFLHILAIACRKNSKNMIGTSFEALWFQWIYFGFLLFIFNVFFVCFFFAERKLMQCDTLVKTKERQYSIYNIFGISIYVFATVHVDTAILHELRYAYATKGTHGFLWYIIDNEKKRKKQKLILVRLTHSLSQFHYLAEYGFRTNALDSK